MFAAWHRRQFERQLLWLFGVPRSGTTWLLRLLASAEKVVPLREPGIGSHLGLLAPEATGLSAAHFEPDRMRVLDVRKSDADYFFNAEFEHVWRDGLRRLLLDRYRGQVAARSRSSRPIAVAKEPHGSHVADLLVSLTPRARALFLYREGRDVIDSQLAASQPGTWATRRLGYQGGEMSTAERRLFITDRAKRWLTSIGAMERARKCLPLGSTAVVRYEDLRTDPVAELGRVFDWLGAPRPKRDLERTANALSFEAVPADEKGPGEFVRAAQPGLWRERFSDEEQALLEEIIGPRLRQLGYA